MCAVEGCPKPATATIYCQMHYRRKRLYGDVNFVQRTQRRWHEYSEVTIDGDVAYVELTQGKRAVIDIADIPKVQGKNWNWSSSTGYAYWGKSSMHDIIIGKAPPNMLTDHDDRDKLNNRRVNLHFVTYSGNAQNTEKFLFSSRIFYHKASGKYQVYIWRWNLPIYLGLVASEEDGRPLQEQAYQLAETVVCAAEFKRQWKLRRANRAV